MQCVVNSQWDFRQILSNGDALIFYLIMIIMQYYYIPFESFLNSELWFVFWVMMFMSTDNEI